MSAIPEIRPPVPPFTLETAVQKVHMAEDGWSSRDPERASLVYPLQFVQCKSAETSSLALRLKMH